MTNENESEVLLDVAIFGEQVDQFLKSDIGQYLLQHAAAEEARGLSELKRVLCTDPEAVWKAQNKVWRGESFRIWLTEAVSAGLKAQEVLEDREE